MIEMHTRMCTHGYHTMMKEINETINFQAYFFYQTFYSSLVSLSIDKIFRCRAEKS